MICEGHVRYREVLYVTFLFYTRRGERKPQRAQRKETAEDAEYAEKKVNAEGAEHL